MIEIWKPVVGYETDYEVSDLGRVRSIDRLKVYPRRDQYSGRDLLVTRRHRGKMLRPGRKPSGHVSVMLGRGNSIDVHVIVLRTFVGPCPDGCEGLHGDDHPANNKLSNLRWGTRSENLHDAVRNGKKPVGEEHYRAKLTAADIPIIRAQCSGPRGCIAALARKYEVSESSIRQVRDGRAWSHVQ